MKSYASTKNQVFDFFEFIPDPSSSFDAKNRKFRWQLLEEPTRLHFFFCKKIFCTTTTKYKLKFLCPKSADQIIVIQKRFL